jgi:hypothetical protein
MSSAIRLQALAKPFYSSPSQDRYITDEVAKQALVEAIWGSLHSPDWNKRLSHWFKYYAEEAAATCLLRNSKDGKTSVALQSTTEFLEFVEILNRNPGETRGEIKRLWQTPAHGAPPRRLNLDPDGALDLTVRLLFMTACRSPSATNVVTLGQVFRPRWKDEESLETFISKSFPEDSLSATQGTRIYPEKLTASWLERYVNVKIHWTNHLPDHLTLQHTSSGKYLYVFSHAGYLEACLPSSENEEDLSKYV